VARIYYERLSDESAGYLEAETSRRRTHTAMILVFEAGPLATEGGGVDFPRIREVVARRLGELPRLRCKLRRVPLDGHPVWVDDREFNLDHHLRHSSLPRPGNALQLARTAARITATPLDRSRPLWDCWVLEGLEGGRFAMILKMHKALASLEGADLLRAILSESGERDDTKGRVRFTPRPAPSPVELFLKEVVQGWSPSRRAVARGVRLVTQPGRAGRELRNRGREVLQVLGYKLRHASESPFDGHLGPHRAFSLQPIDLDVIQQLRRTLGGTVHDGVLTLFTGALRRYVQARRVSPANVDLRAVTPVLEGDGREARSWVVELPVWEERLVDRHELVCEQTRKIRAHSDVASADVLSAGSEWNASRLFVIGARALKTIETGQIAVLQSPGPRAPLYLDGAPLVECYGILPLRDSSGLGASIIGYCGRLFFALNADPDLVGDLERLRESLEEEARAILEEVAAQGPMLRAVGGGGD